MAKRSKHSRSATLSPLKRYVITSQRCEAKRPTTAVKRTVCAASLSDVIAMTDVQWTPAFEGQRPPFEPGNPYRVQPGNTLAVTHGAFSQRMVAPVAQALADAVLADPTIAYLQQPSYRPALLAWAAAEARVIIIEQWVDGMPIESAAESERGQTSPLELLRKWEATASTHRARLGLDPLSRARLGRDVAAAQVDVVAALTRARADAEAIAKDTTS